MNALETALQWHSLGIATIPILAGSKRPALPAWRQYQKRLPTEGELRAWFCVGYSIAVACGWKGLTIVDFDDLNRYNLWLAYHGDMDTYKVRTRKGWHYYFYVKEPTYCTSILWNYCQECQAWTLHRMVPVKMLECRECETQSAPGQEQRIDIKGQGGQAMTPPSVHPSGHKYQGYGHPSQIATIASIKDVIPEYEDVPQWQPRERKPVDPYEAAMREPCGTSVEAVKAQWEWSDVIPLNGTARRGVIMAHCPLHNDGNASFAIYPDGHAYCFGCNWRGDIIDLWAAMHNLTVQEALREMAQ